MQILTPTEYSAIEAQNRTAGKPDMTDFNNACESFRTVCNQIKVYFELDNFKGGFDEMAIIAASPKYKTTDGLALAQNWSAANELCKYEGSKVGYGQPQWWYYCWGLTPMTVSEIGEN